MAKSDKKLFDALDQTHPDYDDWEDDWKRQRDVMGEVPVDKETYLPRNKLEPTHQYSFRVAISEFIPDTPLAVSRLVAGLYHEKPERDIRDPMLKEFITDVDRRGTGINGFMQKEIARLLSYGSTRILVNSPPADPDRTRLEEQEAGIRPYAVSFTPLNVRDWDEDEFGNLTMVKIREIRRGHLDSSDPESPPVERTKFHIFDRTDVRTWEFVAEKGEEPKLLQTTTTTHGLGVVPMVVVYWPRRIRTMIGDAYTRYMAKADIQKFRNESDRDYDTYIHAHPQLRVWSDDEVKEIGINSGDFIKLRPGSQGDEKEDVAYVESPTAAFENLDKAIQDKRDTVQRHSTIDPMSKIDFSSPLSISGVGMAWSFGTSEARTLADIADAAFEIESRMLQMALRYKDGANVKGDPVQVFQEQIQYPEEFDLSSTDTLIDQSERSAQIVNSPTFLKALHKRIVSAKMGDTTPKLLAKMHSEIEDNPLVNTPVGRPNADLFSTVSRGEVVPPEDVGSNADDRPADLGRKNLPRESTRAGRRAGPRSNASRRVESRENA